MAIRDLIPFWKRQEVPVRHIKSENPFQWLQQEMNRMFDNFFQDFRLAHFHGDGMGIFPQLDIREDDNAITVEAEIPGMDAKDIDISVSNNTLTLRGEKKQEKEEKKGNYYHIERSYGTFHRNIPLHCEIESDKVQATFRKGVLTITLPKTPEAQRRTKRIPISSS